jgi:hypothetical protein
MRRSNVFGNCGRRILSPTKAKLSLLLVAAAATLVAFAPTAAQANEADAKDLGQLTEITLENGRLTDGRFILAGRDAQQQLVVAAKFQSGQSRDATRVVKYSAAPDGIVTVSESGFVRPVAEGEATITIAHPAGVSTSAKVSVSHIQQDLAVNFPNQVVPIFTKLGCNGGGCHGKASGQNGFRLSLLGFEPKEDYEHLVNEARGRRIFPAAPDRSLLLEKGIGTVPHGGGARIVADSYNHRIIRRWIEQGMPYGKPEDPEIARIEVFPRERTLLANSEQQLQVTAFYTDGSTEDVTQIAQFDANDTEMGEISPTGLVQTNELNGDVAVMARFVGQVAVFRATIPLGVEVTALPPAKNFVDELVFAKLKTLGLPPSEVCDDATYIRRVTLDLAGRLPTLEETQAFLADTDAAKRDKLVDRLLASGDYADYFANKWNAILRNRRTQEQHKNSTFAFHEWIRQSVYENKPFDEFVRDILAASGEIGENPPVAWYREVKDATQQLEDAAQLFLGMRIQCARCHHHPFEKWSQEDYYGFAAFFSQVGRKPGELNGEERIYHRRGNATAKNPKTNNDVPPTGLGSDPMKLSPDDDPRHALVDWMTEPNNPFFAKSLVNRYWKHFFSRGLVDPEDDMRITNPPSNPALLDALAKHFVDSKFDTKQLLKTIATSTTYQLSSLPNAYNAKDKQNFSRYYPKRMPAEVLLDSIDRVTASTTRFGGVPAGTRAVQLPDNAFNSYFLTVFGKPEGSSACECERSGDANLAQSLHLLNSSDLQGKIASGEGRAAKLTQAKDRSQDDRIAELYLTAFARKPDAQELEIAKTHLAKAGEDEAKLKQAYEDLIWVVINTKQFQFNH